MLFALDFLNRMEQKYPGVLSEPDQLSKETKTFPLKTVLSDDDICGMNALRHWKKDKVLYSFEDNVARAILKQTTDPDRSFPLFLMRQLPYPCIAVQTTPFDIKNLTSQNVIDQYTGNAFLWLDEDRLISAWQIKGDQYFMASMILKDGMTIDDCFENIIFENLREYFLTRQIEKIKNILNVERFSDITSFTSENYHALEKRFGENAEKINSALHLSNVQEILMRYALHIVLYLACENADIEAAEEKLKRGQWASAIEGEPRKVNLHVCQKALKKTEGVQIKDVGYRIAGKFHRSFSGNNKSEKGTGTGTKKGYEKRRAHFHHFWIGPRNGEIAEDIMHPAPGEKGLKLRWVEATEIHPELRDDNAIVIKLD